MRLLKWLDWVKVLVYKPSLIPQAHKVEREQTHIYLYVLARVRACLSVPQKTNNYTY